LNTYRYAKNAPISAIDPLGLWVPLNFVMMAGVSALISGLSPTGLTALPLIPDEGLWVSDGSDTFEQLVQLVAPRPNKVKNKSGIRPIVGNLPNEVVQDMKREWKRMKPAAGGIYDVKNLTDRLPVGEPIIASVGNDTFVNNRVVNDYISLAGEFYGIQNANAHLKGRQRHAHQPYVR
jgi:hypothetical protein